MSDNQPHPMAGIRPEIEEAVINVLKATTSTQTINVGDAMEVYIRCLVSVALESFDGDHAKAAQWMDEWLFPNLRHFRDHLAKGGHSLPDVVGGQRVN